MGSSRVERALTVFPKLRFYFPDIGAATPKLGLVLTHETASVLWLIETITVDKGYALQSQVRSVLGLSQDRFSQILRPLLKAACIRAVRDETDRRNHHLTLTRRGQTILRAFQEEHATLIRDLLTPLSATEQASCVRALECLASTAWERQLNKRERI